MTQQNEVETNNLVIKEEEREEEWTEEKEVETSVKMSWMGSGPKERLNKCKEKSFSYLSLSSQPPIARVVLLEKNRVKIKGWTFIFPNRWSNFNRLV